jgi:integrase
MSLAKKKKSKLVRKAFPIIRTQPSSCGIVYQVDARRQGANSKGCRFNFRTLAEAKAKTAQILEELNKNGLEGLNFDLELRHMAMRAKSLLDPFGKTLADAVQFYLEHLKMETARASGALVGDLAEEWYVSKCNPTKTKPLRERTIEGIRETKNQLKRDFGSLKLTEIREETIDKYLDSKPVSLQRKKNILSLFSQFFNWCVRKGAATENPVKGIEVEVPENEDISILTVEEAEKILRICESDVPEALVYHAICIFAGLRPSECEILVWDDIIESEKVIRVNRLSKTGKRSVTITETLGIWLSSYSGKRNGRVLDQKHYRKYTEQVRIKAGYKLQKKNPDGPEWVEDVMRHSFASYWLPIHRLKPILAAEMGNSVKIIEKHYENLVLPSEAKKFWKILPKNYLEKQSRAEQALLKAIQSK